MISWYLRLSAPLNFRRLPETHAMAPKAWATINTCLTGMGLPLRQGTIVDATIIYAPPSTKNATKARGPEMHRTRKGQQWYFGMKAYIGVDVESGLVHTVTTTAANVADMVEVAELLHGKEKTVYADAGYRGAQKRALKRGRKWYIAAKRGGIKAMAESGVKDATKPVEHMNAAVRSKAEHPFRVVKRQFGYQKVRFKGLAKNTTQILPLFALSSVWMMRRILLVAMGAIGRTPQQVSYVPIWHHKPLYSAKS